jgi:hypothetical protein
MTEREITRATGAIRWIEPVGLDRFDGVDLVEELAGRELSDVEQSWATALNDHVDGTPRTLVLAAAVIRGHEDGELPSAVDTQDVVAVLVEGCDAQTRQVLRILESLRARGEEASGAAAIGAEHLAVLTATAGADGSGTAGLQLALAETLVATGLVEAETDAYGVQRYRIADGVVIGDSAAGWIPAVAQGLAAWASRVGPLEASGEAESAIAAVRGAVALERLPVARMLARAMAPALAATLRWDQWGTVLEAGRDASLRATANADAGYFHHELAIRALCLGDSELAAVELAAAIKAYADAGDDRRGGAARRAATVAGIPLPEGVLALPDQKAVAKKYKGAVVVGGAKKVTVGTASAMVLFGVAGVGILVGAIGGGGSSTPGGGGGGGGVSVASNQDSSSPDQPGLFYNPLVIAGAAPPVVTVAQPTTQSPTASQPSGSAKAPVPTTPTPSHTFVQPSKGAPAPSSTNSQYATLPGITSYVPPPLQSPPPVPPSSTVPVLPPPPPPPTSTVPPPPTTTPTPTTPPSSSAGPSSPPSSSTGL